MRALNGFSADSCIADLMHLPLRRQVFGLGIDLFRRKPRHVRSADLLDLVLRSTAITQKPYRP